MNTTHAINGEIACFDIVIGTGNSYYPYLVGEVNAVEKLGSTEHDSGNLTDDVFVDFQCEKYSERRIKEIEEHFSNLFGEPKRFEDLSLDNVIMPPQNLIRIKEQDLEALLESRENAEVFCNQVLKLSHSTDRKIDDNLVVLKTIYGNDYPLMNTAGTDNTLHRFMGVDLVDFLIKVSDKVRTHFPKGWQFEVSPLYEASLSDNPEVKRLMWQVIRDGTHVFTERDTLISGTSAFNSWTNYPLNEPDIFGYAVEVTGRSGQRIIGNVFDLGNYAEHAKYVKENAIFEDLATLTYSPAFGVNAGKTITVPHSEYLYNPDLLSGKKGKVVSVLLESVKSLGSISDLMHSEHLKRMSYPIGSMEAHLNQLTDKLTEIREPSEKDADAKTNKSLGEKLSAANEKVKRENKQNETDSRKQEER